MYVPSRIPGVIWYKILEYLGINALVRKKCCFLNNRGKVCNAYREQDEIWCKRHGDDLILNRKNEDIYSLLNNMLGPKRIENNTFSALQRLFAHKSNLLYRYRVRQRMNVSLNGFHIEFLDGEYISAPVEYYDKNSLPYDICIYIKSFPQFPKCKQHICLWKFEPLSYWCITTCEVMKNIMEYDFSNYNITHASFAWIYNNAPNLKQIEYYASQTHNSPRTFMSEWQMNVNDIEINWAHPGYMKIYGNFINDYWQEHVLTKKININEF